MAILQWRGQIQVAGVGGIMRSAKWRDHCVVGCGCAAKRFSASIPNASGGHLAIEWLFEVEHARGNDVVDTLERHVDVVGLPAVGFELDRALHHLASFHHDCSDKKGRGTSDLALLDGKQQNYYRAHKQPPTWSLEDASQLIPVRSRKARRGGQHDRLRGAREGDVEPEGDAVAGPRGVAFEGNGDLDFLQLRRFDCLHSVWEVD